MNIFNLFKSKPVDKSKIVEVGDTLSVTWSGDPVEVCVLAIHNNGDMAVVITHHTNKKYIGIECMKHKFNFVNGNYCIVKKHYQ